MKKIKVFSLLILSGMMSYSQNRIWYFGTNGGLNIANQTPYSGSAISTNEGCTTVSDQFGNVYFYSDGVKIWDRNNTQITLPSNLGGNSSSQQTAVAVPIPASIQNNFFLFTTDAGEHTPSNGLRVSLVECAANTVNVDVNQFNIPLQANSTEKLCYTSDGNGGYWVLAHSFDPAGQVGNTFFAYHITSATTQVSDLIPVTTTIGEQHYNSPGSPANANMQGQMKFSPNGNRIALAVTYRKIMEIFDFDLSTGVVSNEILIDHFETLEGNPSGIEFSPNERFLYLGEGFTDVGWNGGFLYQFDLSGSLDPDSLWANKYIIEQHNPSSATESERYPYFSLQLTPDLSSQIPGYQQRIYISKPGKTYLSYIGAPDALGAACNYSGFNNGQTISGTCRLGLPSMSSYSCSCDSGLINSNFETPPVTASSSQSMVNLYPNPNKGSFNLEAIFNYCSIEVFNELGQLQFKQKASGKSTQINEIPVGVYFVKSNFTNGKFFVNKVIVE